MVLGFPQEPFFLLCSAAASLEPFECSLKVIQKPSRWLREPRVRKHLVGHLTNSERGDANFHPHAISQGQPTVLLVVSTLHSYVPSYIP